MLFLAGLMGVLAVGATALVGLEVASEPDEERVEDERGVVDGAQDQASSGEDLISIATAGFEVVSHMSEDAETTTHVISDVSDTLGAPENTPDFFAEEYGAVFGGVVPAAVGSDEQADEIASDAEIIAPQDFLTEMHQDEVTDFSAADDQLVVVFDDLVDPNPLVGLEEDEHQNTRTHLTLNGVRIAAVDEAEGLTLDHITLVAQSTVENAAAA